jgi:protein SCO1/2
MSSTTRQIAGRGARRAMLVVGLTAFLSGCSEPAPPWSSTSITGLMPSLAFELTDAQGDPVTADDYRGKVALLYFGFTHCSDVCPVTLATVSAAVRSLGPEAERVRVLFVSVDPWRDTPEVLDTYAARFGPQVVGLTGDVPALARLARRYRVVFDKTPPVAAEAHAGHQGHEDHYEVSHSNGIFAFDAEHRARLLMREESGVPTLAADLRRLVRE